MTPARELSDADVLIAELRAGRMVVLVDDEDRENEGDLVMAAPVYRRMRLTSWPSMAVD